MHNLNWASGNPPPADKQENFSICFYRSAKSKVSRWGEEQQKRGSTLGRTRQKQRQKEKKSHTWLNYTPTTTASPAWICYSFTQTLQFLWSSCRFSAPELLLVQDERSSCQQRSESHLQVLKIYLNRSFPRIYYFYLDLWRENSWFQQGFVFLRGANLCLKSEHSLYLWDRKWCFANRVLVFKCIFQSGLKKINNLFKFLHHTLFIKQRKLFNDASLEKERFKDSLNL